MPSIEDAIILATGAHRGQKDMAGLPFILHPLRVMASFLQPNEDQERIVAVLHDVVEDTDITLAELKMDYPAVIIEAVDAITRRPEEKYERYIERVGGNPLAARVKLADLADNLNEKRASTGMLSLDIKARYVAARYVLRNAHPIGLTTGVEW